MSIESENKQGLKLKEKVAIQRIKNQKSVNISKSNRSWKSLGRAYKKIKRITQSHY